MCGDVAEGLGQRRKGAGLENFSLTGVSAQWYTLGSGRDFIFSFAGK